MQGIMGKLTQMKTIYILTLQSYLDHSVPSICLRPSQTQRTISLELSNICPYSFYSLYLSLPIFPLYTLFENLNERLDILSAVLTC